MHHRPRNSSLGRFYWRTVKRWPVVYVLICCFGVAVGIGAICLFGEPESDIVKRTFLRVLGVLMFLGYGWLLVAFFGRVKRGVWSSHCDRRILFFIGEQRV
jgi:hypothetical protein